MTNIFEQISNKILENNLLNELQSLSTFKEKYDYCKSHLEQISSGSSRYVFKLNNDCVLKLAKNSKGIAQNEQEVDVYNDSATNGYKELFAPIIKYDENNFSYIIMKLAQKCTPSLFYKLTGIKIKDMSSLLLYFKFGSRRFEISHNLLDIIKNNEFFALLSSYVEDYNIPHGDVSRISSYGIIDDRIVLVDYGLSEEIYDSYYRMNESVKIVYDDIKIVKGELDVINIMKNAKYTLRMLYDRHLDLYMIGNAEKYMHIDLLKYINRYSEIFDSIISEYEDIEAYWEDGHLQGDEKGSWLYTFKFNPNTADKSELGFDGYDAEYRLSYGVIYTREFNLEDIPLYKKLDIEYKNTLTYSYY